MKSVGLDTELAPVLISRFGVNAASDSTLVIRDSSSSSASNERTEMVSSWPSNTPLLPVTNISSTPDHGSASIV